MVVQRVNKDYVIMNYYILPLIGINVKSLPIEFQKVYINKEGTVVFIGFEILISKTFSNNFVSHIEYGDKFYQAYKIPSKYLNDIKLMVKGKYSQISVGAKEVIMHKSGLVYKEIDPLTGKLTTSAPLLALDKAPSLKQFLETKLSRAKQFRAEKDVIISDESDLMDKVTDSIFIETIFENQD